MPRKGKTSSRKSKEVKPATTHATTKPTVTPPSSTTRGYVGRPKRVGSIVKAYTRGKGVEEGVSDVGKFVAEFSEELLSRLGLEGLFKADDVKEIVENIVQNLVEEGRKLNRDSIIKIIETRSDSVYKYLAAKVLREGNLSVELAEFIVFRAPEIAGKAAPQLYPLVKSNSLAVETLRHLWEVYGKPTPLKCPICGFKALTPELTCIVCNGAPSEEDVKKANNFEEELKHAMRSWHRALIEEVIRAGYVYYNGEVKPPSMAKPGGLGALITLSTREKMMLREHLAKITSENPTQ